MCDGTVEIFLKSHPSLTEPVNFTNMDEHESI